MGSTSPGYMLPSGVPQLAGESPYAGYYAKGDAMAGFVAQWATTSTDAERKARLQVVQVSRASAQSTWSL